MNGAYWGLTALDIMGRLGDMKVDEIVPWILMCQDECGSHPLDLLLDSLFWLVVFGSCRY